MEFNKLCLSSPLLIPAWLRRWGGSTMHGASVTTNCFDIHVDLSLCTQFYATTELCFMPQCMKRCPRTLGFFSFLHSHSIPKIWVHCIQVFSEISLCIAFVLFKCGRWICLKWKMLFCKSVKNGIQGICAHHLQSAYPFFPIDGVVPPCTVLQLQQTLSISMNWAFPMHAVLGCKWIAFSEQMHQWYSM